MSKLDEFVSESTVDYLQSIVFVDDNIYTDNGNPRSEGTNVNVGSAMRPQTSTSSGDQVKRETVVPLEEDAEVEDEYETTYHPREITESFARKGIACALYEPRKGFEVSLESEIHKLCKRADVVIFDWDLYGDDGDAVCSLLSLLIKESEAQSPHHVRLCAVYTDKPSLHKVLDRLNTKLEQADCDVEVPDGKLQLVSGATRILIFGKPAVTGRSEDERPYEVPELELADRIIGEFALFHQGLLSGFALHGLAAIRRNTKRLVDKFSRELDGPFLLERALVLDSTEMFDELPELFADELRAVLEDSWPDTVNLTELTKATIDDLEVREPEKSWTDKEGRPIIAKSILLNLLEGGKGGIKDELKQCNQLEHLDKANGFRGVKPKLLSDFEFMVAVEDTMYSGSLASLFCSRTHYHTQSRRLQFGTVVRHKKTEADNWQFSLCLMPICDSQRLRKNPTLFPFWRLDKDVRCGVSAKRSGVTVVNADNTTECLAAGGKIRDKLWLTGFVPDKGFITATNDGNKFRFPASDFIVEWAGELKPLHAQRIAAHLGNEASRVGLVESEWLRLFCDR